MTLVERFDGRVSINDRVFQLLDNLLSSAGVGNLIGGGSHETLILKKRVSMRVIQLDIGFTWGNIIA